MSALTPEEIARLRSKYGWEVWPLADMAVAQAARIAELERARDELRADKERMDYLESEWPREEAWRASGRMGSIPLSMFRENLPITRESIDEARRRWAGEKK